MLRHLIAIPVTRLRVGIINVTVDIDALLGMDIEERRGTDTSIRVIRPVTDPISSRTIGHIITAIETF